jgi:hypothetical protein
VFNKIYLIFFVWFAAQCKGFYLRDPLTKAFTRFFCNGEKLGIIMFDFERLREIFLSQIFVFATSPCQKDQFV